MTGFDQQVEFYENYYVLTDGVNRHQMGRILKVINMANKKKPTTFGKVVEVFLKWTVRGVGVAPIPFADIAEWASSLYHIKKAVQSETQEEAIQYMATATLDFIRGIPVDMGLPVIELVTYALHKPLMNLAMRFWAPIVRHFMEDTPSVFHGAQNVDSDTLERRVTNYNS